MKTFLFFLLCTLGIPSFAQSQLPLFLTGTWKVNNTEQYEHWDILNESTMKGFSYQLKNGQMKISEYLEINQDKEEITYVASVINQNQGKSIHFTLVKEQNAFKFENLNHDFPKQIVYKKISDSEVQVRISDLKRKTFEYRIYKQNIKL